MADINKDPTIAQMVQGMFASLAHRSNAALLLAHHMSKFRDGISNMEQARGGIRGTSSIVDGARGAYVLWDAPGSHARMVCNRMGVVPKRGKVVFGGLAKNNFGGDGELKTYLRQDNGLLVCVQDKLDAMVRQSEPYQLQDMVEAIREWAARAQPFAATGADGVFERRADLPPSLRDQSRSRLQDMVKQLEMEGRIVKCIPLGGKTKSRLDVPNGPIARGELKIKAGSGKDTRDFCGREGTEGEGDE